MREQLELRKKLKKKKPSFLRQRATNLIKLKKCWRKPKGIQSKMRKKLKGHRRPVSIGYSSPKLVRGLHPTGLAQILVNTLSDMDKIKENQGIIISSKVGLKKKVDIIKKIKEKNLIILNIKEPESIIKKLEDKIKKSKEEKLKRETKKEKSKKEALKKAEEKEKESKEKIPEQEEEESKKQKEEKRKLLEKKQ